MGLEVKPTKLQPLSHPAATHAAQEEAEIEDLKRELCALQEEALETPKARRKPLKKRIKELQHLLSQRVEGFKSTHSSACSSHEVTPPASPRAIAIVEKQSAREAPGANPSPEREEADEAEWERRSTGVAQQQGGCARLAAWCSYIQGLLRAAAAVDMWHEQMEASVNEMVKNEILAVRQLMQRRRAEGALPSQFPTRPLCMATGSFAAQVPDSSLSCRPSHSRSHLWRSVTPIRRSRNSE